MNAKEQAYDKKYPFNVATIMVCLIILVGYIEAMLTPSLLSIAKEFGVTYDQVTLVLSMYLVGGVALTPVMGKMGDIYGKKKILTVVLSVYTVAIISTSISSSFPVLIISRTVQGIGLAIFPLGMSIAREEFPRKVVPKVQAIFGSFFGASFAIGLPVGSLVSNNLGWRFTYYTAIPLFIIAAAMAIITIRESRYRKANVSIDYAGATLLAAMLSLLVLFFSQGSAWGWPNMYSILSVFGGTLSESSLTSLLLLLITILAVLLLIYEFRYRNRGGDPILDFRIMSQKNVAIAYIVGFIVNLGLFLSTIALSYRLEYPAPAGFGKSILSAGLTITAFAGGSVAGGIMAAMLVQKTGAKPLAIIGTVTAAIGFLLEATIPGYTLLWMYSIICGVGLALTLGTLSNFIIFTVKPEDMGIATGMSSTLYNIGSSIGTPVAAAILTTFTSVYVIDSIPLKLASSHAFSYVFALASFAFLVAAALLFMAKEVISIKRARTPRQEYRDVIENEN